METPNNRKQTMKRLMHLFKIDWFKRNPSYLTDYKTFMDDLITKGYTRKEDTRSPGKTLFIPHHGLYHPSKPGKIRVVFDCSTDFDERSVNKELLTGRDLATQIVEVLTRFQQNNIAFTRGI